MKLKLSEARILVYLDNVREDYKFARKMSVKLDTDYDYTLGILKAMKYKGWIRARRSDNKIFYTLNKKAPLNEAYDLV